MIRSPAWLRRFAMGLVLLGAVHLLATFPVYRTQWSTLPLTSGLATIWMYVSAGLWVAGSGMLLGMLAESAKDPEAIWPGPLARGVANFLLVGGILAPALMWSNPIAWIVAVLALGAWWATRKVV
ncbi:MAG: hypothetical protein RL173_528 [Fibrobacterota bacterium]|jgi:hypothetical protein